MLKITKYTSEMISEIQKIYRDDRVMRYIGDGQVYSEQESKDGLKKILGRYKSGTQQGHWAVFNKDQTYVGKVLLLPWDNGIDFEIGYIVLPEFWKQGYGLKMARLIFDLAKKDGHDKLIATVHRKNKASMRILKKLGFKFQKVVKKEGRRKDLYKWIKPTSRAGRTHLHL